MSLGSHAEVRDLRVPFPARAKFKAWDTCSSEIVITDLLAPAQPRHWSGPGRHHADAKPGDCPSPLVQSVGPERQKHRGSIVGAGQAKGSQATFTLCLQMSAKV